jgi:hypothetical protein
MPLDTKDLDTKSVEGACVGGCVRKLNRMVSATYDGALAKTGLKTSQFSVLVSVANRKQARPQENKTSSDGRVDTQPQRRSDMREGVVAARAGRGSP